MVHIFAAEREFFAPVQNLVKVLTSATLTIFQQGKKRYALQSAKIVETDADVL